MKCKYRLRWLNSKGAFLVVVWTLLLCIGCVPHFNLFLNTLTRNNVLVPTKWYLVITLSMACLSALLTGWMADAKLGNYRLLRFGVALLFIYAVLNCLLLVLEAVYHWESNPIFRWLHFGLSSSLFVPSLFILIVTSLPLGLDQMPDASAASITSYIAWFVCSLFIGHWLTEVVYLVNDTYLKETILQQNSNLISSLLSVLCIGVVLVSNFLFSPKWLIVEHRSPQSLQAIYQVVKFALKHKTPLNPSALVMYQKGNIPSRMDLGKVRYGGPFTNEQVEDVKTILRLMVISLSLFFIVCFLNLHSSLESVPTKPFLGLPLCSTKIIYLFTYNSPWCSILAIIVYEFVIYPLVGNKLPSILKRIGTVSLMMTIVSFACFILELVNYVSNDGKSNAVTGVIAHILGLSANGALVQAFINFILEFVCAQSPYNMRGLFVSFTGPLALLSIAIGLITGHYLSKPFCSHSWCQLLQFSVKASVCLIGFLLFCVVARWYKRRVRDDNYFPQEEAYNRYLTASAS